MKKQTNQEKWEKELEQVLLNRIKNIGEFEQTYFGYPIDLLKELQDFIRQLLKKRNAKWKEEKKNLYLRIKMLGEEKLRK